MQFYRPPTPWSNNQERLLTEALQVGNIPGVVLQETVRPPLPQIQPFPPKFGYGEPQDRVPGIDMVLEAYRYFPDNKDALSGGPWGWQGSARNVGADQW